MIDNAAVLGVLSLVTAVLFLIDLAGPRGRSTSKHSQTEKQDAEKISFGYPTLPRENKEELKTDKNSLPKPKFFPEKFKKVYKREQADKVLENPETNENDDVDTFIQSQANGYHKFTDKQPEENPSFEKMDKSKYGSVRNGNSRLFIENEPFHKAPPRQNNKQLEKHSKNPESPTFSSQQYEEEMLKNISYLRLLDEKQKVSKKAEDKFNEPESSKSYQAFKDYKRNLSQQMDNQVQSVEREKQKHWETFDEESLPPFSIKEDYLPELQTPVFARIKENKQQKSYNIYDNYSNYASPNVKKEDSNTDSLRSKTSTLKTKPPTLQQIAEYFGLEQKKWPKTEKKEAASQVDKDELPVVSFLLPMSAVRDTKQNGDFRNEPVSPTDPGYVQYTAQNWNERLHRNYSGRTPRHSPTD